MIYEETSNVCKAAIHDGKIPMDESGEFVLVIANGEDKYESSY